MIFIKPYDESRIQINAERSILYELKDQFTFYAKDYKFSPKFKQKLWDGRISLLNLRNQTLPKGLINDLCQKLTNAEYDFQVDEKLSPSSIDVDLLYEKIISKINLKLVPREYQINAYKFAMKNKRALILSPTSSGKSLIIFLIAATMRLVNKKTLIIVPTTNLVTQMNSDFNDYSQTDFKCQRISDGASKNIQSDVVISTWQSIYKLDSEWFNQFSTIIGDECHLFAANSLTGLMDKATQVPYRFGFTGTLDEAKANEMTLRGIFGDIHKTTTTKELMDRGEVANLSIKSITIKYSEDERKYFYNQKYDYDKEIEFLLSNPKRNNFIIKLAGKLEGNTLLLFRYVDKHGKMLYDEIKNQYPDKNVIYVDGSTKKDSREELRSFVENNNNCIIVASLGVFSTGVSIKNLRNCIFCNPIKAKIKTLQSIGRILRIAANKKEAVLYDICDDLQYRRKDNITKKHFIERMKHYSDSEFDVSFFEHSF